MRLLLSRFVFMLYECTYIQPMASNNHRSSSDLGQLRFTLNLTTTR